MAISVRTCRSADEFRAAARAIGHYFGWEPTEEDAERFSKILPLERLHAAVEGETFVGSAGVLPCELTVPGGRVPCAGVTMVGVLPTHRRRGLLTRMMAAQLEDVRGRGEAVAALWASDEQIYGRYGYGLASLSMQLKLPRNWAHFRPGFTERSGSLRLLGHEDALRTFP